MTEIKKLTDGKIYYPKTPCEWVGKPKVSKILDVLVSCGGGMGGAQWHEYITDKKVSGVGLHDYKRIDGTKVSLNSRWVVKVDYVYLIRVNYKHYNTNFSSTYGTTQELVFISDTDKVVLIKNYH